MGTANRYGGPESSSALIPTWLDDPEPAIPSDTSAPDDSSAQDSDSPEETHSRRNGSHCRHPLPQIVLILRRSFNQLPERETERHFGGGFRHVKSGAGA
jgi:hypothetical protein